jgi:hypothetical protein
MKYLLFLTVLLSLLTDPTKIGQINKIKAEAKKAYLSGDFRVAAQKYQYLIDSLDVNEDEVRMNLANSYFNLKDTASALGEYQTLSQSKEGYIRSKAEMQLGVMANQTSKFEEALNHFKQAIRADPANVDARYNYELLKKKLEEEKKKQQQDQKDQNKDQKDQQDKQQKDKKDQQDQNKKDQQDQQKDEQNKDQKNEDQKKDEQKDKQQKEEESQDDKKEKQELPQSIKDKLKDMKISEEKAKMILEAMKNQEKQYLQQNKRKATKPKQKGKPDW